MNCELCTPENELLLWQNGLCRVVLVEDANYPGFCRVIWNRHVREMTDLAEDERQDFMRVVFAVESVVRKVMPLQRLKHVPEAPAWVAGLD